MMDSQIDEPKKLVYIHSTCGSVLNYYEIDQYTTSWMWDGKKYVKRRLVVSEDPDGNIYDCPKCDEFEVQNI